MNKFDVNQKRPSGEYETSIATLDGLLVTEIEILKPKVCIFFTGPHFDWRIRKIFPDVEFTAIEGYSINQFSRLKHQELPVLSFRTYHPGYLRRSRLEEKVVEFIKGL
jgi:hypothetical protein